MRFILIKGKWLSEMKCRMSIVIAVQCRYHSPYFHRFTRVKMIQDLTIIS